MDEVSRQSHVRDWRSFSDGYSVIDVSRSMRSRVTGEFDLVELDGCEVRDRLGILGAEQSPIGVVRRVYPQTITSSPSFRFAGRSNRKASRATVMQISPAAEDGLSAES